MVLRVGVTGHRPNRLPAPPHIKLSEEIDRVLLALRRGAEAVLAAEPALFDPAPVECRLVSSLAEGADRMAAEAGLALGYRLSAPLPFHRDAYRQDFETAASVAEFDDLLARAGSVFELDGDHVAEAPRAYEAAGLMVLRQSDLVLAVWDGGPPAGRGGAPELIQRAVTAGVPVVWIDPANPVARLLRRGGEASGADVRDLQKTAPELSDAELIRLVNEIAAPPCMPAEPHAHKLTGKAHHHHEESTGARQAKAQKRARHALETFLAEPDRRAPFVSSYRILMVLCGAGRLAPDRRDHLAKAQARWADYEDVLGGYAAASPARIGSRPFQAFAWTDALAGFYGELHRGAAVRNFALAALVVGLAMWSVFDVEHRIKPWLVMAELAVLAIIVVRTVVGVMGRWHERWADYRDLGERLRVLRVLALTGSGQVPPQPAEDDPFDPPQPSWTNWYHAAILREVELPNLAVDAAYLDAVLATLTSSELDDQIAYHHRNAERMEQVDLKLEIVGLVALVALVGLAVYYLVAHYFAHGLEEPFSLMGWEGHELLPTILTFIAGLFPAIGASCLGIRESGEFRRRRDLSLGMVDRLRRFRARVHRIRQAPSLAEVAGLNEAAAEAMTAEVGDWSYLFRTKPLGLPG